MFFPASKIFWTLAQPVTFATVLLAIGTVLLWTRWSRAGRVILSGLAIAAAFFVTVPIGDWIIAPLENRFPPVMDPGARVDGIIVLGGAANALTTMDRGQIALNDAAERLTAFTALARRYPQARLVFSGGSGDPFAQQHREADLIPAFLREQGIEPGRLIIERDSRNTWENAVRSLELVRPAPWERWLLVTSSFHMPRAIGCFRRAGANLTPYPVDYRTARRFPLLRRDSRDNVDLVTDAVREWIGLLAYRLTDRTPALFPGPEHRGGR